MHVKTSVFAIIGHIFCWPAAAVGHVGGNGNTGQVKWPTKSKLALAARAEQSRAGRTRICCLFLCLMGPKGTDGGISRQRRVGSIDCCGVPCILPTGAHRAYQYILDSSGLQLDYTT